MANSLKPIFDRVSPDELLFDVHNPRFGDGLGTTSQTEIQKAIFGAPYYASELVDSLLENGYIDYEPLVVKRHKEKFVVIEGNRRLAAIKEIRGNFDKYSDRRNDLEEIPVIIFPGQKDGDEGDAIRIYLGLRHLLGFREWPPFAKAEFLEKESRREGGLDRIVKEVRITKSNARRFLIPYRILNDAKIKLPHEEDFWVLAEALQRAGVKQFLQLDVDSKDLSVRGYDKSNFKLLLDDLYGPRDAKMATRNSTLKKVRETRDLSTYGSVLASDRAAKALHGGKSLNEAAIYVDTKEQSRTRLSRIVKELDLLLRNLLQGDKSDGLVAVLRSFKELESAIKAYLKTNA